MSITASQIKAIAGSGARTDLVAAIVKGWPVAQAKAKLTTANRASHFLAQIMTETGGLRILEESGAYSAPRISQIFGMGHHSAAVTPAEARSIASLPVPQRGPALFNRVYGVGNPRKMREFNNTGPNDGWLYRGGGMMQATGKSNYAVIERKTGLPVVAHPELLHNPDSAFTAAYLEWAQDGRCNAAADRDDVAGVRRIINGGSNGLAECRGYLAKAKKTLADYSAAAPMAVFAAAEDAASDDLTRGTEDAAPLPPPVPEDDPELLDVKLRLKAMNYSPGIVNGQWGGMTAGALAGFINDRGGHIAAPASLDAFRAVKDDITSEMDIAESETPRFVRPVSEGRKAADPATVAAVAPEAVPAKESRALTIWGTITALFTGIYKTFSDSISNVWDFLFEHKDDIPTDPGVLQTAWGWVTGLPSEVWIFAVAIGFGYLAIRLHMTVKKITDGVTTGARQ